MNKRLLSLLILVLAIMLPMKLWAQEPYAVLTTDSTSVLSSDPTGVTYAQTLTFYYDDQKTARGGMSVGPFSGYPDYQAWYTQRESITKAIFDASFANCTSITSTVYWFYNCSKLSQIEGIENLKTDNVTEMRYMFDGCSSLTSLDVSNFNTANVTDMSNMFDRCSKLTSLDVSNFKTDNVTDMGYMFWSCSKLTSLDVSGFKTDNVRDMNNMFWNCSSLTSLDVSNFKTDNVWDMSSMFDGCSKLTSLDVSNFKTDNVMNMTSMFDGCSKLTSLDVSNFKTDNVWEMSSMFSGCSGLTSLDVSNFKTDNVTGMRNMFDHCSKLTSLDVSGFNTTKVTDMSWMFSGCSGLTNLDVSNFNTTKVTDMSWMFDQCSSLTSLDVSNFNTTKVTDMSWMFDQCSSLTSLDLSSFNTANVTDMSNMFDGCSSLTSLDVSNFNTANVTDMSNMFDRCSKLTNLDISNFNTANVIDMSAMFGSCSNLTNLILGSFNTENVENMDGMFWQCSSLKNLNVSSFNTSKVTDISGMFNGCSSLKTIYAGDDWSTEKVTDGYDMFTSCTQLVGGAGTNYDANHVDHTYAHIDGGATNPGYFTDKNAPAVQDITVTLKDKNDNYWYDITGTDYSGYEAIKWVLPEPRMGVVNPDFSMNMLNVFIGNKLSFTVNGNAQPEDISGEFAFASSDQFISPNGDVLIYDDGNTQAEIAMLNPVTGEMSLVNTAATRRLLNEDINSLKLPLRVKAFYKGQEVTVTNGDFTILVVRPINAEGISSESLFDSQSFSIDLIDLVSLTDWRNVSFVAELEPSVPDFYAYYNVKSITITGATDSNTASDIITTNLSGTVKSLKQSSYMLQLAYEPTGLTTINYRDSYGTFSLTNYGENLSTFSLYIPLTVTYEWGSLETTAEIRFGSPNSSNSEIIVFVDPTVKEICVSNWDVDGDGELSYNEAASVTDLGEVFKNNNEITSFDELEFFTGLGNIGKEAFAGSSLTSIIIPINVITIGTSAFSGCNNLYSVIIPDNVTAIGYATFDNCSSLKTVNIPSGLTVIEDCTFRGCSKLESINIPEGITAIKTSAFYGCQSLTSVYIPESVKEIGELAFKRCNNLKSINLPSGLSTITRQLFYEDNNLMSIVIPKSVTSFELSAFAFCNSLATVTCCIQNPFEINYTTGEYYWHSAFYGIKHNAVLYVPVGTREKYISTSGWSEQFSNIIESEEAGTTINTTTTPTFTRNGNTLTIASTTEGATIYYTLDGTDPTTESTLYTGPITLNQNCMVKAIAVADGYIDSEVATYIVDWLGESEPEPYAVISEGTKLTFYYDTHKADYGSYAYGVGPFDYYDQRGWHEYKETITDVEFDVSFADCISLTSTAYWFSECKNLTTITGIGNLKTDNVADMDYMFYNCSGLTNLDVSGFNTANVTSMDYMFSDCSSLTTIYAGSGWGTEAVTDGGDMFTGCTKLVGGAGTTYDENNVNDYTYAHIDGGPSNPGYLTLKLAMGDANGDGYVNIADAVATVTNILGVPTAEDFYQYAADMNNDQVIDIFDVTLIVNAAFDAASPAPAMTRGSAGNIMMENISMTADADDIYLGIDQPERFTAMQFDVILPEGVELVHVRLASATTDHQLSFVKRGENEYRVIGLSLSNATFRSLDGQLLKLQTTGSAVDSDVKMSNVLFVTPSNKTVTGIEAVNRSMSNVQRSTWYNLKGQRVSKQQLGKGIYIMNHKKVVMDNYRQAY